MDKDEIKNKLSQLLKQLLESSSITVERAQEISVSFEDLCNQAIDPNDFKNLFTKLVEKYPELEPLITEIVLEKASTEEINSIRDTLKQIARNK